MRPGGDPGGDRRNDFIINLHERYVAGLGHEFAIRDRRNDFIINLHERYVAGLGHEFAIPGLQIRYPPRYLLR